MDRTSKSTVLRYLIGVTLVLLSGIVALFPAFVLSPMARLLVVDAPPQRSDVIVILLGQERGERVQRALELYRQRYAERFVFIAGFHNRPWFGIESPEMYRWISGGKEYRDQLLAGGVPADRISMVDGFEAYDTATELHAVSRHLRKDGMTSVLLVSSASHSLRVGTIWARLCPTITATVAAAKDPELEWWWRTYRTRRAVIYEYGALFKEMIRQGADLVRDVA